MNCANYSTLLHRQKLIWSHLLSLLPLYCVLLGSFCHHHHHFRHIARCSRCSASLFCSVCSVFFFVFIVVILFIVCYLSRWIKLFKLFTRQTDHAMCNIYSNRPCMRCGLKCTRTLLQSRLAPGARQCSPCLRLVVSVSSACRTLRSAQRYTWLLNGIDIKAWNQAQDSYFQKKNKTNKRLDSSCFKVHFEKIPTIFGAPAPVILIESVQHNRHIIR